MKRLIFVFKEVPYDSQPQDTGVGQYILDLAQGLKDRWEVIIITKHHTNQYHTYFYNGVKIIALPCYGLFGLNSVKIIDYLLYNLEVLFVLLRVIIKGGKPTVIEFANWETDGFLFSLANHFFKIPIIVRLHSGSLLHRQSTHLNFATQLIHFFETYVSRQNFTNLICSTKTHAQISLANYAIKKHVTIIPLGLVVPKKLAPFPVTNNMNILYVGRIEEKKGVGEILQAMEAILDCYPKAHFHFIGNDYDKFWQSKKALQFSDVLRSNATIHGYVARHELAEFFRRATLCVFPSYYESFGLTAAQAMAFGKAVISTKVGGIPTVIEHMKDGFLIPPRDPSALAEAVLYLLRNKSVRERLMKNAPKKVKNFFSMEAMIRSSDEFYSSLIRSL